MELTADWSPPTLLDTAHRDQQLAVSGNDYVRIEDAILLRSHQLLPIHKEDADIEGVFNVECGYAPGFADLGHFHEVERLRAEKFIRRLIVGWPQNGDHLQTLALHTV